MTPRQHRFVREFLRDCNAARAAVRAGYAPRWARGTAAKLRKRPELRAAIDRALGVEEQRLLLDTERVIAQLMRIAFSDIRAYLASGPDGGARLKPLEALGAAERAAIAALEPGGKRRGPSLRLDGKIEALRALARHVGLDEQRHAADPALLVAETRRLRERLLRGAGLDPTAVLPPDPDDDC